MLCTCRRATRPLHLTPAVSEGSLPRCHLQLCICNLPSDTWSTVAEQMSPDPPRTSRALRRASQLWGLRELSSRQCSELALSNCVLQRSSLVLFAVWLVGGGVLLEHPGRPSDPSTASPWILPQIQQWYASVSGVTAARTSLDCSMQGCRISQRS